MIGWEPVPTLRDLESVRPSCEDDPVRVQGVLRLIEAIAIMERFKLAAETRDCGVADVVNFRYRVFPENQRRTPPDQRTYVLNEETAAGFWNHMTTLRMQAENEASREPEPFERRTVRRMIL